LNKLRKNIRGLFLNFKVALEQCEDGSYTIYVPSLPGCISEGKTKEEALNNIKEAIELYLEPIEDELISYEKPIFEEVAL